MPFRLLEIDSISATDLENVRHFKFEKMRVYAVVSISGDSSQPAQRTKVDQLGGVNPTWNQPLQFTINDSAANQNRLTLVFQLRCKRTIGDKDIGEVRVPVKDLLGKIGAFQEVRRGVSQPTGVTHGDLNFTCTFGKIDDALTPSPESTPESQVPQLKRAASKIFTTVAAAGLSAAVHEFAKNLGG